MKKSVFGSLALIAAVLMIGLLISGCGMPGKASQETGEEKTGKAATVEPIEQTTPVKITQQPAEGEAVKGGAGAAEKEETKAEGSETVIEVLGLNGFSVMELTVKKGETISWVNKHPGERNVVLTFQLEKPRQTIASPQIRYGETYKRSFEEAGTYSFWDTGSGVKGKLIVE